MEPILLKLINDLPDSNIPSDKVKKKIHASIPVPTDYRILWADITNLHGHPAGVVITDRAIVFKATKGEVNAINEELSRQHSWYEPDDYKIDWIYRIIPWEHVNPDTLKIVKRETGRCNTQYALKVNGEPIIQFSSSSLCHFFMQYTSHAAKRQSRIEALSDRATVHAITTVDASAALFNARYGVDQIGSGHGIYIEEWGAKLDVLAGKQSTVVGRDNAKNGPDKIVDGCPIQCKYYASASATIAACFSKNEETGLSEFKYYDLSGQPMRIEVPSDQYEKALSIMQKRISKGTVKGISDPNEAYTIVRRGWVTYKQARNLAKPGNIDSLKFDTANGIVTCSSTLGITAISIFVEVLRETKDFKKALMCGLQVGFRVYGYSLVGYIVSSQIARTSLARTLTPVVANAERIIGMDMVRSFMNSYRASAGDKLASVKEIQSSEVKAVGTSLITESTLIALYLATDSFELAKGKMSLTQFVKNSTSIMTSLLAANLGRIVAGEVINKIDDNGSMSRAQANIISLGTSAIVATVFQNLTDGIINRIWEDDAPKMQRMFESVLSYTAFDYMLTGEEQGRLIDEIRNDAKGLERLLKTLISSTQQEKEILDYLDPKLKSVLSARMPISVGEEDICDGINTILSDDEDSE